MIILRSFHPVIQVLWDEEASKVPTPFGILGPWVQTILSSSTSFFRPALHIDDIRPVVAGQRFVTKYFTNQNAPTPQKYMVHGLGLELKYLSRDTKYWKKYRPWSSWYFNYPTSRVGDQNIISEDLLKLDEFLKTKWVCL